MKKFLLSFILLLSFAIPNLNAKEVTDVLDINAFGITPDNSVVYAYYEASGTSGAKYSAVCATPKSNDDNAGSIQLNNSTSNVVIGSGPSTKTNRGIVCTESPGKLKSVYVDFKNDNGKALKLRVNGTQYSNRMTNIANGTDACTFDANHQDVYTHESKNNTDYISFQATGLVYVSSITIIWEVEDDTPTGPQNLTNAQFSWSAESASVSTKSADNTFPTLINTENLSVSYDSSVPGVATIDNNGEISLVAAGSTIISAIFAGNDDYNAKTVTYTLNVSAADATWVAETASDNPGNANDWYSSIIDNANNTIWAATNGTNSSNHPKYYDIGSGLRVYGGGSFTVSSDKKLAAITITFSGTGYTFSGSNTNVVQTVEPNSTSYTWEVSRTCRLQKVEVTYAEPKPAELAFDKTTAECKALATLTGTFTQATTADVTFTVKKGETVVDDVFACADGEYLFTPTSAGTYTITATSPANADYLAGEATLTVTVTKNAGSLAWNPTELTINDDEIASAVLTKETNAEVTFTVKSGDAVLDGGYDLDYTAETGKFLIDFGRAGEYTVTASAAATDAYEACDDAVLTITVSEEKVTTITITSETELNLYVGDIDAIEATVNSGAELTFSSSDEDVVTVDEDGYIEAVGAGKATITVAAAAYNGYPANTAEVSVTVSRKPAGIAFSKETITVYADATYEAVTFANPNELTVTIETNDDSVAEWKNGKLVAYAAGEATITAKTAQTDEYAAGEVTLAVTVTNDAPVYTFNGNKVTVTVANAAEIMYSLSKLNETEICSDEVEGDSFQLTLTEDCVLEIVPTNADGVSKEFNKVFRVNVVKGENKWALVTSTDGLATDGTQYVIATYAKAGDKSNEPTTNRVMTAVNGTKYSSAEATFSEDRTAITSLPTDAKIITLENGTNGYYLKTGESTYVGYKASATDLSEATSGADASISFTGNNANISFASGYQVMYNASVPASGGEIFRHYKTSIIGTKGYCSVALYKYTSTGSITVKNPTASLCYAEMVSAGEWHMTVAIERDENIASHTLRVFKHTAAQSGANAPRRAASKDKVHEVTLDPANGSVSPYNSAEDLHDITISDVDGFADGQHSISFELDTYYKDGSMVTGISNPEPYTVNSTTPTGVESVAAEQSEAQAEYYTLQGVRIQAENLQPGLYIQRQGTRTAKILVR